MKKVEIIYLSISIGFSLFFYHYMYFFRVIPLQLIRMMEVYGLLSPLGGVFLNSTEKYAGFKRKDIRHQAG